MANLFFPLLKMGFLAPILERTNGVYKAYYLEGCLSVTFYLNDPQTNGPGYKLG